MVQAWSRSWSASRRAAAILMAQLETRYAAAGTAGLAGGVVLLCLGAPRRAMQVLIAIVAVTLPLGFSTQSVFSTTLLPTRGRPTSTSITWSRSADRHLLAMIAAAVVLALSLFTSRAHGVLKSLRVEPLTASGAGLLFVAGVLSLLMPRIGLSPASSC